MKRSLPPSLPMRYRMMQAILGPVLKLTGMTCRDVFRLSAQRMDGPLKPVDWLRLRMHLMLCVVCRKMPEQFENQREWLRCCHEDYGHEADFDNLNALSKEAKERIEQHLKQEASK